MKLVIFLIGIVICTAQRSPNRRQNNNNWDFDNNDNQQWNRPNSNSGQNQWGSRQDSNRPWNNNNQNRPSGNQNRPWNQNQQTSSTSSSTSSFGPTTSSGFSTTASPAYTACLDRCQTTIEYNPVCGSDWRTYKNLQRLNCAVNCGANVELNFMGACDPA